jgi:hypothetical protein
MLIFSNKYSLLGNSNDSRHPKATISSSILRNCRLIFSNHCSLGNRTNSDPCNSNDSSLRNSPSRRTPTCRTKYRAQVVVAVMVAAGDVLPAAAA